MRLIEVCYEFKYSNDPGDWVYDSKLIVAGDDTGITLKHFEEHVRAGTIEPEDDGSDTVTVVDYRLISAGISKPSVDFISPDVVLAQAVTHGLIIPMEPHEGDGEDHEEAEAPPAG